MNRMEEEKLFLKEDCYIDFKKFVYMRRGLPCALTHLEILLLERLSLNLGHIVSYTELTSAFDNEIELSDIAVHISRLRKKLEDTPKAPKNLISVKGVGYILIASL
ncbi:helix-turn-helix domain-containing protein [Paenibacillus macerans]|uniref:winged helix-turn-helix domain-containing protein n=1 Tax=Paenibacillus macerans TaxID=44252 RepID=UPI002E1C3277|nr:helix-turn-helix domain-containing protein [Paenibacillus macerans]